MSNPFTALIAARHATRILAEVGHRNVDVDYLSTIKEPAMTMTVTLTFRWPMGHRILGLPGGGAKCENIHGHNWIADVELPADDNLAIEFGDVKAKVGGWITDHLDHGFAADKDDPFTEYLIDHGLKFVALDGPPTTERIAALIAEQTERLVSVRPVRVHLMEGYRNAATWTAQ